LHCAALKSNKINKCPGKKEEEKDETATDTFNFSKWQLTDIRLAHSIHSLI